MSDMGSTDTVRQRGETGVSAGPAAGLAAGQPIVAFDFDGTLTIRDSFTEFLRWRAGPAGWALGLVKMAPAVAHYARDRDRGRIKAASVREFLGGVDQETLEAEDFHWLGQSFRALSVPIVSVLEGGYSNDLPELILAYLRGLDGK